MIDKDSFILGMLVGGFLAAFITTVLLSKDKWVCEELLPRNVECVWSAPK
jgi:hypothetical protein